MNDSGETCLWHTSTITHEVLTACTGTHDIFSVDEFAWCPFCGKEIELKLQEVEE